MVMIYHPHKKTINNQEGAAAIEFAIILPLLLLFIFGIIEFSLFLYNKQVITNAAREGARRGVIMRYPRYVDTENDEIIEKVNEFAKSYLITFGDDTFDTDTDIGDVIIKISVDDPPILPWIRVDDDTNPNYLYIFNPGTNLIVEANFFYDFLFLSTIGIGPINLQSISTMKME